MRPNLAHMFFAMFFSHATFTLAGGTVASSPDQVVRFQTLARDIVLCSLARHFIPTGPLSTQLYKWVPVTEGSPAMD